MRTDTMLNRPTSPSFFFAVMARCCAAVVVIGVLAVNAGCESSGTGNEPDPTPSVDGGEPESTPDGGIVAVALEEMAPSTRNDLRWKRAKALENGIGQALLLDAGEVCNELGRYGCVDRVHLVALGGNDPYEQGLYEAPTSPGATTAVAVERLLWSACYRAVEKEKAATPQLVFLDLDLEAEALDLDRPATRFAVEDTIINLYRRFHARNPLAREREILMELTADASGAPVSAAAFAVQACFAVGSTSETLFY